MKTTVFLACALFAGTTTSANTPNGEATTTTTATESASESSKLSLTLGPDIEVKFGGRLFLDWTWVTGDSPTYDTDDGVEFRTARFYAAGTLYDLVDFKAQYDFAGGDTDFKDVWMGIKDFLGDADIKVGHVKEPFSLEEQTSSRFITFNERSLANAFVPGRNTGVLVSDSIGDSGFGWAAGVFRATDDFGNGNDSGDADEADSEYAFTARVAGDFLNDSEDVLHVGVAGSIRQPDDDSVRYRSRPEAHLLNRVVDTGSIDTDQVQLYGAEAAWVKGPVSVQGEYIYSDVQADNSSDDADYSGYYVEGSYYLTGEMRNYKGLKFDRVKPLENRTREGGLGSHQIAVRYSMIDLDDGPSNDKLEDITVGYNWWLNPNTAVKLNYIHSENDSPDDSADIVVLRFQLDF